MSQYQTLSPFPLVAVLQTAGRVPSLDFFLGQIKWDLGHGCMWCGRGGFVEL